MKKLITSIFSLTALVIATEAQPATIAGIDNITLLDVDDSVITSNNQFVTSTSSGSGFVSANDPSIKDALTDDFDFSLFTYAVSGEPGAYIDFNFADTVTGSDQLVFFFAGNVDINGNVVTSFDLDINADGIIEAAGNDIVPFIPNIDPSPGFAVQDFDGSIFTLTAAIVDLGDFGLAPNEELETFRFYMANNGNYPALGNVGYIAAVPLPLPVVLFSSGLAFLGFIARRKNLK